MRAGDAFTSRVQPISNFYKGPAALSGSNSAKSVAVDDRGNVYVTGYTYSTNSGNDYITLVYSSTGVPLATNYYNGPSNGTDQPETSFCLALAGNGKAYVTGTSEADLLTISYIFSPTITTQPANQSCNFGEPITFTVAAAGADPLTYLWKHDGATLSDDAHISGSTTATLTIHLVNSNDAGDYSVVVTNTIGQVESFPAHLSVAGSALQFSGLKFLDDRTVELTGTSPANGRMELSVSSNLVDWVPMITFTNSSSFIWNDADSTNHPKRFYRGRWQP
jgi:hypothetical protein